MKIERDLQSLRFKFESSIHPQIFNKYKHDVISNFVKTTYGEICNKMDIDDIIKFFNIEVNIPKDFINNDSINLSTKINLYNTKTISGKISDVDFDCNRKVDFKIGDCLIGSYLANFIQVLNVISIQIVINNKTIIVNKKDIRFGYNRDVDQYGDATEYVYVHTLFFGKTDMMKFLEDNIGENISFIINYEKTI